MNWDRNALRLKFRYLEEEVLRGKSRKQSSFLSQSIENQKLHHIFKNHLSFPFFRVLLWKWNPHCNQFLNFQYIANETPVHDWSNSIFRIHLKLDTRLCSIENTINWKMFVSPLSPFQNWAGALKAAFTTRIGEHNGDFTTLNSKFK